LGTPLTTQNYTYNSQNQRTDLSYDANGNMTSLNGYTFGWTNRRLTSATSTDNSISYTYNHDGIRTSKTINGITTYYVVDENNNVVKQYELENDVETNVIEFVYDSNNTPIYFTYNYATYYYEKNLQGDIVAILDANGNTVVEYTYNIWGELVSITGSLADTIGTINPLRYRGYYYDTETNLYYLQSRYYSPDLMRFISQDDPMLSNAQGEPIGSNLYVYCLNNPANMFDPSGFASYMVAIAVNSPVSLNSTMAFDLKTMSAGHTFVELYKDGRKTVARGFGSYSPSTVVVAVSRVTVKGIIKDEKLKRRSITIFYTITRKQYQKIYDYLYMKKVPKYNIVSYNCTTFAIGALEVAGIRHRFKKHFWNLGKKTYLLAGTTFTFGEITFSISKNILSKGAIAISAFILSFSSSYGYYPARLAYDIAHGVS
jgi:RHS repeat-associated protein